MKIKLTLLSIMVILMFVSIGIAMENPSASAVCWVAFIIISVATCAINLEQPY